MIGTWNYRVITDTLDESLRLGKDALTPLVQARNSILNADIAIDNRYRTRLNSYIESTYMYIMNKHLNFTSPLSSAVQALNQHVLGKYGYINLDTFLDAQFLEVPEAFAKISNFIGIPVTLIGSAKAAWEDVDKNWENINYITWDKIGWHNV